MEKPNRINYYKPQPKGRTLRNKWYDTAQWHKVRQLYKQAFPLCKMCFDKGIITTGALVDHIKPLNQVNVWDTHNGLYGHPTDPDNLQTLCVKCHAIKTTKEKQTKVY